MRRVPIALSFLLAAGLCAQQPTLADTFRPAADKLIEQVKSEGARHTYNALSELTDTIGNRISGSPQLVRAEDWAYAQMKAAGLQNVHFETAKVPHWVRGQESCQMIAPYAKPLDMIGLGGTVATPKGGLTAEVVAVSTFEEFNKLPDAAIKGKIVLFDEAWQGYGKSVAYRYAGPTEAAKRGAVACLIRTVGSASLGNPHTGATSLGPGVPMIPSAALSIEDATLLHRLCERGVMVQVHLSMEARMLGETTGRNVIGEIPGSEKPNEVVILSGHLDSWDVGQGAQDDGIGALLSLGAARAMLKAGLHTKRTVRVILWTCEEWGGYGAKDYAAAHKAESPNIVAAFESDSGNGRIQGFSVDLHGEEDAPGQTRDGDPAERKAVALMSSLAPLLPEGARKMDIGSSGEDVGYLIPNGAVGIGVGHDASRYFEVHHSKADTFDHIIYDDLSYNLQAYSVMAYLLADMPDRLK
ncbi:MAG: M20/M25/M40 family metallo-hydrolase [Acidobacteria bacterium]|nr:M20/M25/M40 family metallo-hydrolase [Acidobacteriota bacterium]